MYPNIDELQPSMNVPTDSSVTPNSDPTNKGQLSNTILKWGKCDIVRLELWTWNIIIFVTWRSAYVVGLFTFNGESYIVIYTHADIYRGTQRDTIANNESSVNMYRSTNVQIMFNNF